MTDHLIGFNDVKYFIRIKKINSFVFYLTIKIEKLSNCLPFDFTRIYICVQHNHTVYRQFNPLLMLIEVGRTYRNNVVNYI